MIYQPIRPTHPPEVEFYNSYFDITPEQCVSYFYTPLPQLEMDIYVITFNNLFLVEYQIATLCRFMETPFNLIVVDNNSGLHREESEQVLQLCIREGVTYLRTPDNYYQRKENFDPTMKLGTTMNWLYQQCVLKRKPKYFGFLDHDCFAIRPIDLRAYLDEKGMYGLVVRNPTTGAWNLHVAPNFYRTDFVSHLPLDFRASYQHNLDTGSMNYELLYKHLRAADYELEHSSYRFAPEDVNRKGSVQHYQTIDNGAWYHMIASSHDQLVGDGKFKLTYTKGFLDSRLMR